ncbi:MAG TPA: hypothetical protein VMS93_11300 [Candidatus Saccharimonadales bacterium]|nr:hypothetical protein [Candidatus Saccharimonadales bacterium]
MLLAWPAAHAQTQGGSRASEDLRQMRAALLEIRVRCHGRRWEDSADLLLRIKRTFSRTTPALLTRLSPDDVSHFSYALATLEDGLIARDLEQVEQGMQLSHSSVAQMQGRFPGEVDEELDDLQRACSDAVQATARGDFQEVQYHLEDLAAGRHRLDTAGMAYARESWVHFGLAAETLARAARSHNLPATQAAAQAVDRDLRDIRDRILNR